MAFIALILASLVLAGILAVQDNRTAWLATRSARRRQNGGGQFAFGSCAECD